MTRHIICQEGNEVLPETHILIGALQWDPDAFLPITVGFDFFRMAGRASDIRRENNGDITAEIELFDDIKKLTAGLDNEDKAWCYSIQMQPFERHQWKDIWWISNATIRMIAIIPDMAFWSNKATA